MPTIKKKYNHAINQRIKQLRKEKGLTQSELASLLQYESGNTVLYWENGRSPVPVEVVEKLANIFDVTANYLLGLSDSRIDLDKPTNLSDLVANSMRKNSTLKDYLYCLGYNLEILGHDDKYRLTFLNQEVQENDGVYYKRMLELDKSQVQELKKSIEEFIEFKMEKLKSN